MKTRILWLFVFPLVFICGFNQASACSCIERDKPTAEFRKFPAVFVGTAKNRPSRFGTTFVIDEALKGVKKGEVSIYTNGGCSTSFKEGEQYLVYAFFENEEKKSYATNICTRTRPAKFVEDEIAVLRSVAKGAFEPRIYGRVEEIVRGIKLEYKENAPMPGIKVIANNGVNFYQTVTDKDGLFRFVNVKTGTYRIEVKLPSTHKLGDDSWNFPGKTGTDYSYQVTTSDSPDFIEVETRVDGRIKGRALDSQGNPVSKGVYVTLITKETVDNQDDKIQYIGTETNKNGYFEFYGIPEGEYYLGVNLDLRQPWKNNPYPKTFYPNAGTPESATLIKLGYGQKLDGFNLTLPPPLNSVVVKGKVLKADGNPATGTTVYVSNQARHDFEDFVWLKTDQNGEFSAVCLEGLNYRFAIYGNGYSRADAEIIQKIDGQANKPIEFVLKQ